MLEDFCFKVYEYYLNLHSNVFELYLRILGYTVLDYSRFYYFEYADNYLIYNSDYDNVDFIINHFIVNKIDDDVIYYEERNDRSKTIFKFNINKDVIRNFSSIATEILEGNLNNFELDKFLSSLDEEELAYFSKLMNI